MRSSILFAAAAAAPIVAGLKTSISGGAKVVNQCSYAVPLQDVPAMANGIENGKMATATLAAGGKSDSTYSTPFVQLLTDGGWSIKLNTIGSWTNIMQFEYTWADDNQLWYDLSFVDGKESEHPAWEFQCPDCPSPPHRGAYQHSTDDSNGMQKPAPPDVTITLVLCPGNSGSSGSSDNSGSSAASSAAPAPSSEAPAPTTTPAPAPSTTLQTYASTTSEIKLKQAKVQDAPVTTSSEVPAPSPAAAEVDADVVVVYETKVVTAVVTETAHARKRRHEHRHPHGHAF